MAGASRGPQDQEAKDGLIRLCHKRRLHCRTWPGNPSSCSAKKMDPQVKRAGDAQRPAIAGFGNFLRSSANAGRFRFHGRSAPVRVGEKQVGDCRHSGSW